MFLWNIPNSISEEIILKEKEEKMTTTPYWNFWKVVLSGWLIRHPRKFFNIILLFSAFILVRLLN
jgi:hypothetical protein